MIDTHFKALVIEEKEGVYHGSVQQKSTNELPEHNLLVRVHYSSLNYKDALSASGNKGVTKRYPHTPGIDSVGVVVSCESDAFNPGDAVLVCGYDLGMNTSGGFGEYIRVPSEWAVRLPANLTMKESMLYGTAGFTAAQCVRALLRHGVQPADGPVLVTGATGGVGSVAVSILAQSGFQVAALTGKSENDFLKKAGAHTIINRHTFTGSSHKTLLRERWAAVVDTIGGEYLATAIKSTQYGGIVTCCGNAASAELPITVYPFILRGVSLVGIDSAKTDIQTREEVWRLLASDWKLDHLNDWYRVIELDQLMEHIAKMLQGQLTGRVIVKLKH